MSNDIVFIGAYLVDIILVSILAQRCWKGALCGVIVNLILLGFWAQKSIVFLGFHSNLGNLFYAAAIFGMSIIAYRQSVTQVIWGIITSYIGIVLFVTMCHIAIYLPGNVLYSYELMKVFIGNNNILAASFVAFFLGNIINMHMIKINSSFFGKILANVSAQAVDSLIFFPIAFGMHLDWHVLVQWMTSGFLIKSILHVIDTPVFLLVTRKLKAKY